MTAIGDLVQRVRAAVFPAVMVLLAGYFAYHAVAGVNGLLSVRGHLEARETLAAEVAALETTQAQLEARRRLLDPRLNSNRIIDQDYVDELARRDLGLAGEGDLILRLPPLDAGQARSQ